MLAALQNRRIEPMQPNRRLVREAIARAPIRAPAMALALIAATVSALPEPASPAPAAQARKMSYHEARRGLFALSKFPTAPIVMLGDSLTEAAPWSDLTGCRPIANRGIGGDTTARILARLDDVLAMQPRAVFLMAGVNDISLRVPSETTAKNFAAILDRLNAAKVQTFVHYVLPVAAGQRRKSMNDEISALNATIARLIANRPDTTAVDLRPLVRGPGGALREELAWDGLHLSAQGYELWRDAIAAEIAKYCTP